ncbi:MAG TPA: DUF2164 domain-containing protein [Fontimonas sp.]
MAIKISSDQRKQAVASIERYFRSNMDEPIGSLAADALLDYFMKEIAPLAYNAAVAEVQQRLQTRVMEVDAEVYEDAFTYWGKADTVIRRK